MKKNIYLVKNDDQTFPYLEESLKKIEVGEEDNKKVLDNHEKIEEFMPGGRWIECEFLDDVLGKHESKLQRTLAQPNEELVEEWQEQPEGERSKWLAEYRTERVDAIVVSIVCTSYDGNPLTEDEVEELPIRIKDLLVSVCNKRFGGNHEAFLQNVCRRLDS